MEFLPILKELVREGVEFVVVGGISAVLQGVPMSTLDVDIVHARSRENRRRLVRALRSLGACYRRDPQRLSPHVEDLASPDHHLLETRYADFDLLGTIHGGLGYDELLPRSVRVEIEPGLVVRALDLRGLIEVKEAVGRDKDKAQLPLLRATLAERLRVGDPWIEPPGSGGG
jgi:predicted nucleotidyltransferase